VLAQPPRECGGCAAKASPQLVGALVGQLQRGNEPPDLLVGLTNPDDASVQLLDAERAIVTSVDVSPPLADDPYIAGAISAANAVNDIYAMGAKVLSALVVAAFPRETDPQIITAMMSGAQDVLDRCGGTLTGGHTVHSKGMLFGLSVTGVVHPEHIWRVGGAEPGDLLILSKPLGVGLTVTSQDPSVLPGALAVMQTPVRQAAQALASLPRPPHAVTDVTGYGLLGHLLDMVDPSITMRVYVNEIPLLEGAMDLATAGWRTSAHDTNLAWVQRHCAGEVSDDWMALLVDPQTAGGLLAAIPPGPVPHGFFQIGTVKARLSPQDADIFITEGAGQL